MYQVFRDVRTGHVSWQGEHFRSGFAGDAALGFMHVYRAAAVNHNPRPFLRQQPRSGIPKPAARAGDHGDFTFELQIHLSPS